MQPVLQTRIEDNSVTQSLRVWVVCRLILSE
jgi:hypothetical protein